MSMAVVEQAAPEHVPHSPYKQLGLSSLLGAVFVLAALIFLFGGLPTLWEMALGVNEAIAAGQTPVVNPFLSATLLFLVMVVVGAALFWLGRELESRASQPGLRAGVFFGAVTIALVLWLVTRLGHTMATPGEPNLIAAGFMWVIAAALAGGVFWLLGQPGMGRWLIRQEEAGWFHAASYKGNQGVRVRRGTLVGLLTVGVCGIYSLVAGRSLGSTYRGTIDWIWELPFTRDAGSYLYVPLVHNAPLVVPILLAGVVFWISWRVVNWPTFADFLIATEAEINKVSWTTRRRLVQDTIVVLVTVFLFTAFLFLIDIMWIKVLTHPWVSVLQVDIKEEFQKQQQKTQW
jgi:preprotein translocase SecE subunit